MILMCCLSRGCAWLRVTTPETPQRKCEVMAARPTQADEACAQSRVLRSSACALDAGACDLVYEVQCAQSHLVSSSALPGACFLLCSNPPLLTTFRMQGPWYTKTLKQHKTLNINKIKSLTNISWGGVKYTIFGTHQRAMQEKQQQASMWVCTHLGRKAPPSTSLEAP